MPASARGRVNPINWIYSYILKMKVIKCDWAESMQLYKYLQILNVKNIYKYIIIICLPWSEVHGEFTLCSCLLKIKLQNMKLKVIKCKIKIKVKINLKLKLGIRCDGWHNTFYEKYLQKLRVVLNLVWLYFFF